LGLYAIAIFAGFSLAIDAEDLGYTSDQVVIAESQLQSGLEVLGTLAWLISAAVWIVFSIRLTLALKQPGWIAVYVIGALVPYLGTLIVAGPLLYHIGCARKLIDPIGVPFGFLGPNTGRLRTALRL
jgi:hypothetical protein